MDKLTDYELELFIQQVEQHEMLRAPTRLRDEILEKSQQIQIQNTQVKPFQQKRITQSQAKKELIVYSFRTAAAVAVAVFLFAFVNQPTLQAQMRFNKYNNWESKWLHREEDKYKERDAYWDGEEIPSNNWQISNILQELEQKMEGFLGGSVW